jgi:hypothetical protein
MARKLAVLTPEEEKAWEFAFAFYVEDGLKDDEAGFSAWQDLQKEFPRLREFDGCEA